MTDGFHQIKLAETIERAASYGLFGDFNDPFTSSFELAIDKLKEEADELANALHGGSGNNNRILDELGDVAFVIERLAWMLQLDVADALEAATKKINHRLDRCEELLGKAKQPQSVREWAWNEAKREELLQDSSQEYQLQTNLEEYIYRAIGVIVKPEEVMAFINQQVSLTLKRWGDAQMSGQSKMVISDSTLAIVTQVANDCLRRIGLHGILTCDMEFDCVTRTIRIARFNHKESAGTHVHD